MGRFGILWLVVKLDSMYLSVSYAFVLFVGVKRAYSRQNTLTMLFSILIYYFKVMSPLFAMLTALVLNPHLWGSLWYTGNLHSSSF